MAVAKDFLSQKAPDNYVAGLGRGATGFVTRSDLGLSKEGPSDDQIKDALAKRAAQLGAAAPTAYGVTEAKLEEEDDDRFGDLENDVGLFAGGLYGPEDEEADRIWAEVDEKMTKRRMNPKKEAARIRREEEERKKNPTISDMFADVRRGLETVTPEEWENIPDVEDMTAKLKRTRRDRQNERRFYSVPDSVLAGARNYAKMNTSISVRDDEDEDADASTRAREVDFNAIGAARQRQLNATFDQLEEAAGINRHRTEENLMELAQALEYLPEQQTWADVQRARELFKSLTKSYPTNAYGWMSLARIEETAGNLQEARNIIRAACEHCTKNPDVWMEAVRLWREGNNMNSKKLVYEGVRRNPKSYELWMLAIELEDDPEQKKSVVRQGLDHLPVSESLWKLATNLETENENAVLILRRAVQFLPHSVDLWLALAKLEERVEGPVKAQSVINEARRKLPTSHEIWIAALSLLVRTGEEQKARDLMPRCVKYLTDKSAMLPRADWIAEAEKAERDGHPLLSEIIINETFEYELSPDDTRLEVWKEHAIASISRGCLETARAMYAYMIKTFNKVPQAWSYVIDFYRRHRSTDELLEQLERATASCPDEDDFFIQRAKELFHCGRRQEAANVIEAAVQAKGTEKRYLASVELEINAGMKEQASFHLKLARKAMATDRVWMKSAVLERSMGRLDAALSLINEAVVMWPQSPKLYMIKGQIYESQSDLRTARETYDVGTKKCPRSVPLWILAVRLEARFTGLTKARTIIDRARLANPKNEDLWLEVVRMERLNFKDNRRIQNAMAMVNRALSECPKSGRLLAEKVLYLEDRTKRKTAALQAMSTVENDKYIFLAIARIFWALRAHEKAATWFERLVKLDPDFADGWVWYYAFLKQHGTDEKRNDLLSRFDLEEPRHGEIWQTVNKAPENLGKKSEDILEIAVKATTDPKWAIQSAA